MKRPGSRLYLLLLFVPLFASAQIDPVSRNLIQFGYSQAFEGHQPFSGYAYYYHNQPDFLRTNLTLRLTIAPTYVDSNLGFVGGLGPNTDFAIGMAGGGFADSYYEIRDGTFYPSESFDGDGGEVSFDLYHLFDPGRLIPLNLVVEGTAHYSVFARDNTAPTFQLPNDHGDFSLRAGFRWGGVEPVLFPALAMELSIWYEGHYRTDSGAYGFSGDRVLKDQSHLFWTEAALSYTLTNSQQNIYLRLTTGSSVDADRFSAYRLGGFLPLAAEYPLSLPGYFYQEISARQFALLNANYLLPLDTRMHWSLDLDASTAAVSYLGGESQPGTWLSGVGGGILYHSPGNHFKALLDYGYGVNAIRDGHRGAHTVGFLMQIDLGHRPGEGINTSQPNLNRSLQWLFGE
ncbi:MAG TPA: hypothetical protein VGI03_06585 [Verrucomicrobiae bacterium]